MNHLTKATRRGVATSCRNLELYYDVISPYSWFAFEVLLRYQKKWNLDLVYKPVLLGGIFKITGNISPILIPSKATALLADVYRSAKYYKVPLRELNCTDLISNGSLHPMRFVTAVEMYSPKHTTQVSRQFWMKRFNSNKDFNPIEAIKDVGKKAGMEDSDIDMILSKMTTLEVKEKLKVTTQEAIEKKAFGVPTLINEIDGKNEIYFGADRFPMLAQSIGEDWVGPDPDGTSEL